MSPHCICCTNLHCIAFSCHVVHESVPVVYAVEAEPIVEGVAKETVAADQDPANPEPAQDKPRCIPPYF
uniref:Uncharacterized protein n=1 Tax=Arundo donax TaxID=35708 RepID=A0A0A9C226_ARUDO